MQSPKKLNNKTFLTYATMSFQMIATILVCVFIGRFLDKKIDFTFPVCTLIFVLTGVFLSMYQFIRKL